VIFFSDWIPIGFIAWVTFTEDFSEGYV